jgi:hypothetical protein
MQVFKGSTRRPLRVHHPRQLPEGKNESQRIRALESRADVQSIRRGFCGEGAIERPPSLSAWVRWRWREPIDAGRENKRLTAAAEPKASGGPHHKRCGVLAAHFGTAKLGYKLVLSEWNDDTQFRQVLNHLNQFALPKRKEP